MVASSYLAWPLISLALVHGLHVPSHEQVVLPQGHPPNSGILRRFTFDTSDNREALAIVEDLQLAGAEIWQVSGNHIDVYIPPAFPNLHSLPTQGGIQHTDSILPPSASTPPPPSMAWNFTSLSNSTFHATYHTLPDIEAFSVQLAEHFPDLVSLVNIGHSAEGREMIALEISKDKGLRRKQDGETYNSEYNTKKVGFVITGAQHAREWIAVSTAMYLAHALVADPSESYSLASLLNHFDFHMVLVPNPDGYVYTWEHDRFWYKNRQVVGPNEKCVGLDMNRNWGHKWKPAAEFPLHGDVKKRKKAPKVPTDPCSYWYPGHRPFESPEVNNIANYITTLPHLRAYVDLRAYGQMISAPFSFTCKRDPKDAEDQIEAAMGAARAIKEAHGTVFTTGTLCEMLYRAPGNVVDYMYAKAGIKFSYAAHLRDTGTYGFSLPPEWIRPVGEETVNMIKSIAHFIGAKKSG